MPKRNCLILGGIIIYLIVIILALIVLVKCLISKMAISKSQQEIEDLIQIRRAMLEDVDQLQEIGKRTFVETFSADNTGENMQKYLEEGFAKEKVIQEITDPNSEFYFAEMDGTVIGYLKLNYGESQTELKDSKALEIERIYVLNQFHGKKVGQLLYAKAIEIAGQKNAEYVWLGVWEKNARAINFYKKNGFIEFDKHLFKLGNDEQTDIMMKLQLKSA
jgi:diamine N-acetyltransferase